MNTLATAQAALNSSASAFAAAFSDVVVQLAGQPHDRTDEEHAAFVANVVGLAVLVHEATTKLVDLTAAHAGCVQ